MSQEIQKTAEKSVVPKTVKGWLTSDYLRTQLALVAPKHFSAERAIRVALTALLKTPKIGQCSPESVMQCMLNCSALGLEPDGRLAHLIPYGNTCTLIVDYKGIVKLAKNSGDVSSVFAQIVCEKDGFKWNNGEATHEINWREDRGAMYAAYAVITFKDGTKQTDVMTRYEIDSIRKRSKASGSGPWVTDYNEMAKKTVFRRASKWITLSPEVADALDNEDTPTPHNAASSVVIDMPEPEAPQSADEPIGEAEAITDAEANRIADQAAKESREAAASPQQSRSEAPATPTPGTAAGSPQSDVEAFCAKHGFTFSDFQRWAIESGVVDNADSIADFSEVPTEAATRITRPGAKLKMLDQLLTLKASRKGIK